MLSTAVRALATLPFRESALFNAKQTSRYSHLFQEKGPSNWSDRNGRGVPLTFSRAGHYGAGSSSTGSKSSSGRAILILGTLAATALYSQSKNKRSDEVQKSLPSPIRSSFIQNLPIKEMMQVFIYGDLWITVLKDIPPRIVAYNTKTERVAWEAPILSPYEAGSLSSKYPVFKIEQEGDCLALSFLNHRTVYFLDAKTGALMSYGCTPAKQTMMYSKTAHIAANGFTYQLYKPGDSQTLLGGTFVDGIWQEAFRRECPHEELIALGSHVAFRGLEGDGHNGIASYYEIVNRGGHTVYLKKCLSVAVEGNKLYTIEMKETKNGSSAYLQTRTLTDDESVISDVERSIDLGLSHAAFGRVCHNGKLILFDDDIDGTYPIFVDLKSGKVTKGSHVYYGKHFINPETAEVWFIRANLDHIGIIFHEIDCVSIKGKRTIIA